MYCNIDLWKTWKRESFFKLSSLLKSLKTVVTVRRRVKMKRFVSFFQGFTDFYFLVHKNIIIFVTVACLMTSLPLIMGYRSCYQVSWMNLKNFITKCDGIITNFDSLVHLIQIATRIKGPKCLQRIPYKKGLSTTEAMSSPKACTYKTDKAVMIFAVYIA